MKNHSLLTKIASVANELDYAGFTKEAKALDNMMLKLAEERYPDDLPVYEVLKANLSKHGFGQFIENTPTQFLFEIRNRELDNPDVFLLRKAISHTDEEYPEYYRGKQPALMELRETGYSNDVNRQFLIDAYKAIDASGKKSTDHARKYLEDAQKGGNADYVKDYQRFLNPRPDLGLF